MQTVKDTVNYVSEKAQELTSGASKEANKEIAKDSNASVGDRLSAAGNAVSDKVDELGHAGKAEAHKQSAKN